MRSRVLASASAHSSLPRMQIRQGWRAFLITLFWLSTHALNASAQERSLSWDSLSVQAELDANGMLYITETHAMRLDGPWNGGERKLRVEPHQSLTMIWLYEITRDGSRKMYLPGSLDRVGQYAFADANTLRWRARAANDPPFSNDLRTFELRYALSGVVLPNGSDYVLNHDFAFSDRPGVIRKFSATLKLDPAWQALTPVPPRIEANELAPGQSVVQRIDLRYLREGKPLAAASGSAALQLPASGSLAATVFAGLLLLAAGLFASFWRRERSSGHLEPLPDSTHVDREWLTTHLLCHPAEVVGAAWDRRIGTPEVAALLARLTAEGKLQSEVEPAAKGRGQPVLRLKLKQNRRLFRGYESTLIDRMFVSGDTTDTALIRSYYASSGFDPAQLIKPGLETEVAGLFGRQRPPRRRWLTVLTLIAAGVAAVALMSTANIRPQTGPWLFISLFTLLICWISASYHAGRYRDTVVDVRSRAIRTAGSAAVYFGWLAYIYLFADSDLTILQLGLLALITLTACWHVTSSLEPRELPASYRLRRQIAVARAYFIRELESPTPRIDDAWSAYLIAFDLGPDMDQWFRAFGGEQTEDSMSSRSPSMGSSSWQSSSSSTASSQPWSGGGGAFGGAGASGGWAVAIGAFAAGVSAPSSSSGSDSSSSSGSSSSGGGGGGGW